MLRNIRWFLKLFIVYTHFLRWELPDPIGGGFRTHEMMYAEWKTWLWFQWRVECYKYTDPPEHFNCRCSLIPIFRQKVLGEFSEPEDKSVSYDQFDAEEGFFEEEENSDESE